MANSEVQELPEKSVKIQSNTRFWIAIIVGAILSMIIGWWSGFVLVEVGSIDLVAMFLYSFLVPLSISSIGFYLGWLFKKKAVKYRHPTDVREEIIQLDFEDWKQFVKAHNSRYFNLVSVGKIWYYFVPIIQICITIGIPLYIFRISPIISDFVALIIAMNISILWVISIYGGFRSTSNAASEDFTLPLIREAAQLAKIQAKISGVSKAQIVMDCSVFDDYKIYQNPRVVLRIESIEKEGYIESISEEMNSISRMLVVLYETEDLPQVVWWWLSRDRNFRKYVGNDESGYYVKYPVPSNITSIGVKDVSLLTKNAVSIIIREYIRERQSSESLETILGELGAKKP
ncbi:MAG: hypothetical protein GF411_10340 [Candidatus Lokiarchaeota archaeon]|nr:hypothetical protein [Candidatus Lokiarchaeota archaeon]